MESITEQLEINCVSHFKLIYKFEFTDIEISQIYDTIQDLEKDFEQTIQKFVETCNANGFKYVEIYECKFLVPIEGGVSLVANGDLHEPFTDYLVEKLKADARLETTAKR